MASLTGMEIVADSFIYLNGNNIIGVQNFNQGVQHSKIAG